MSKREDGIFLEHIGVVVREIEKDREDYLSFLGCKIATEMIHVSSQKIVCQHLIQENSGMHLQLIQPLDISSPSYNALTRGGGVNHMCFAVPDMEKVLHLAKKAGCRIVINPFYGEGVSNRRACFIYKPGMGLTEIVEKKYQLDE